MITLTSDRQIGPLLRQLRGDAGLSLRDVAARSRMSKSAIAKREQSRAGYLGVLIETVNALDHDVIVQKRRRPGARPTGTGWPT